MASLSKWRTFFDTHANFICPLIVGSSCLEAFWEVSPQHSKSLTRHSTKLTLKALHKALISWLLEHRQPDCHPLERDSLRQKHESLFHCKHNNPPWNLVFSTLAPLLPSGFRRQRKLKLAEVTVIHVKAETKLQLNGDRWKQLAGKTATAPFGKHMAMA